jgi:hypothetical protein
MDTLPLPPCPDLAQYKKRAKELVKAANSRDPAAVQQWANGWVNALARARNVDDSDFVRDSIARAVRALEERVASAMRAPNARFTIADAQFLIANAHSFATWADLARHIDPTVRTHESAGTFEAAADAVVTGDIETLTELLDEYPDLVHQHSERVHHATLLHYVAANGVEDWRQKTPPNAVAIARLLLERGAAVDALADTYGRDHWQTTMNLLVSSTHPADAGLQAALVDVLADYGAAVDGVKRDSSPILTALDFGYEDAAQALVRRGARVDNVVTAAASGRLDLIKRFVIDPDTLADGVPLIAPAWHHVPDDPKKHIELALGWACRFRQNDVANYLLDLGVDKASEGSHRMTALHWAAANGDTQLVARLLALGAPLEAENAWGGTVLNSTLHFAQYIPVEGADYPDIIERLLAAGADVSVVDPEPTGIAAIDEIIARYRPHTR